MNTLYLRAAHRGPALLAIKDQSGSVFGGFVTEPFETRVGYYGTGQCFLFRGMKIETKEMERSDGAVTAEDEDKDGEEKRQVEVFHATGDNEYLIHAEAGFIAMGGGYVFHHPLHHTHTHPLFLLLAMAFLDSGSTKISLTDIRRRVARSGIRSFRPGRVLLVLGWSFGHLAFEFPIPPSPFFSFLCLSLSFSLFDNFSHSSIQSFGL